LVQAKAAVHGGGLVGGLALKVAKPDGLRRVLAKPDGRPRSLKAVLAVAGKALDDAGITYGIMDDALRDMVMELLDKVAQGEPAAIARKVAEGEEPQPGQDGYVEYPLNHNSRPYHVLADLPATSGRKRCTVVHAQEVLATAHPPTAASKGTSVQGESLESEGGVARPVSLEAVAGDNTEVSKEKVVAACDGLCEEDATGRLRVIPEIVLEQVDETTGRIPETGLSRANVAVVGDARGGHGIATEENLFVGTGEGGGAVEGSAGIQARNLVVGGPLAGAGEKRGAPIEVEEACAVGEVVNRAITSRRILIAGDCHFARLEAEEDILVDGSLRGGLAAASTCLSVVGDIGTEAGGSNTRISLPSGEAGEQRRRRVAVRAKRYRDQLEELRRQQQQLEDQSEKRIAADPYWAKLAAGEKVRPRGPIQSQTLVQYTQYVDQKRKLEGQLKNVKQAVDRLVVEEDEEESRADDGATVVVGGTLHLDVSFEIAREMGPEDGDVPVSFAYDGRRFDQSTLGRLRSLLAKEVGAYREQQLAAVEEKRAAIDQMFEESAKKPKGPELKDQTFEIEATWLPEEDEDGDEEVDDPNLEVKVVAAVRASEPQQTLVTSIARTRTPLENVAVELRPQGVRGRFGAVPNEHPPQKWRADAGICEELDGISVCGISATAVLSRRDQLLPEDGTGR